MSAFDRIIGYQTIKEELLQICDMIHNREIYENLGAKLPQGILLYGDPGLGKSSSWQKALLPKADCRHILSAVVRAAMILSEKFADTS